MPVIARMLVFACALLSQLAARFAEQGGAVEGAAAGAGASASAGSVASSAVRDSDAFLRRIPYKIEVIDPTERELRELFKIMTPIMGFSYKQDPIDYLIETHYKPVHRPFRCCQPRDILLQVKNLCLYEGVEPELTNERMDLTVENYFAIM